MPYLGYQQIIVSDKVMSAPDFDWPAGATHAELQAEDQPIRYTMDGKTNPTQTTGMILRTSADPVMFTVDDLRRMRFIRGAANDAKLNVHYFAGRIV